MPLYRDFTPHSRPSAVAIGNFDGFHRGHRAIIQTLKEAAGQGDRDTVIVTFTPHPRIYLNHDFHTIRTDSQRQSDLSAQNPDALYFIDFSAVMQHEAREFVRDILREHLAMETLVIGDDFRFGHGRCGNVEFLKILAGELRFELRVVPPASIDGQRISSSAIRKKLQGGDVAAAYRMLGHPYSIDGTVVHGSGRGRTLGVPTINLQTQNGILPRGVFYTIMEWQGRPYHSVTNIGFTPTFSGGSLTVETHILDFSHDLYGQSLSLYFLAKIRDELRFDTPQKLVDQIRHDSARARELAATCLDPL